MKQQNIPLTLLFQQEQQLGLENLKKQWTKKKQRANCINQSKLTQLNQKIIISLRNMGISNASDIKQQFNQEVCIKDLPPNKHIINSRNKKQQKKNKYFLKNSNLQSSSSLLLQHRIQATKLQKTAFKSKYIAELKKPSTKLINTQYNKKNRKQTHSQIHQLINQLILFG
ncbi:hypothetical protein ABPG72_016057 [Tetrahymena utriculariae]